MMLSRQLLFLFTIISLPPIISLSNITKATFKQILWGGELFRDIIICALGDNQFLVNSCAYFSFDSPLWIGSIWLRCITDTEGKHGKKWLHITSGSSVRLCVAAVLNAGLGPSCLPSGSFGHAWKQMETQSVFPFHRDQQFCTVQQQRVPQSHCCNQLTSVKYGAAQITANVPH